MNDQIKVVCYDDTIKKVGVIADTHLPTRARFIPPLVFQTFMDVQLILHAGDLVDEAVIDEFKTLAPVEAIAGNMDPLLLKRKLGRLKLIRIGKLAIGLLHGDLSGRMIDFGFVANLFKPEEPEAIVFGHLHQPVIRRIGRTLFFNPGSAVEPRRGSKASCGLLTINNVDIEGEIIYL